jgi:hypothetical protein
MLNGQKKLLQCLFGSFCLVASIGIATSALAADTLIVNQYMKPNQHLTSANGKYRLMFQADGNLVLQRQSDNAQLWTSDTAQQNGKRLVLGSDGNLRLESQGKTPAWTSGTRGSRVNRLTVHDDGNVAMYDTANKEVWSTGTSQDVSTRASTATVSYVGGGSKLAQSGKTMTITRPSTTNAGDMMILAIQTAEGVVPTSAGGDWIRFGRCAVETNNDTTCNSAATDDDQGIALFYNQAGSGDAKTYTINKPDGKWTAAFLFVVRNAANAAPVSIKKVLDDGTNTQTKCEDLPALSRGMNVCILSHDDAQQMTTPSGWTLRSPTSLIDKDGALITYTRGSGTAVGDTIIQYNGEDPLNQPGNGINYSFQIKPIP